MKILITGGAGYIGTACVQAYINKGHTVVVFDNLSSGQIDKVPKGAEVIKGDVTDKAALLALCAGAGFEVVVHCAAKKSVGESERDPDLYFKTNVLGSLNVLSVMAECKIPTIVFSSTAAVYAPQTESSLYTEDMPLAPVSVYGRTKRMVEEMIVAYVNAGKISQYVIFRYFNVAGDAGLLYQEKAAENVFPVIARAIHANHPFSIFGTRYETSDGTCVRDYIHLCDLVTAHVLALTSKKSGIFNLGTGQGYSVRQLIEEFNAQLETPLAVEEAEARPGDLASVVACAKKAKEVLGWFPERTLGAMVADTIKVYGK